MTISLRPFRPLDVKEVGELLIENYQPGNQDGNWLRPEWDYMHSHPMLDEDSLSKIGIWEDAGNIVAAVHYEHSLGEAFFQVHPKYTHLKPNLLEYAEDNLSSQDDQGQKSLRIYIKDYDQEFEGIALDRSYKLTDKQERPMSLFPITPNLPDVQLPEGFRILSLADENDLVKIHRVLWRGFNHPGEPPEDELEGRQKMQSSPNFQKDLTLVVVEPGGNYVCFCGFWYEDMNRYALIEPLATDPDYRRMGLAGAAVKEGIRRCADLDAKEIFVGSDQAFYLSLGFKVRYHTRSWSKVIR